MNGDETQVVRRANGLTRFFRFLTAGGWLLLAFTVVLPIIALVLELATRMCAEIFFDPLPGAGHILVVAAVPIAYLVAWLGARSAPQRLRWPAAFLAGLAFGLSLYYAFLCLPIAMLGALVLVMGWWYFGFGLLGLLPLSPVLAFVGGFFIRRRLLKAYTGNARGRLRGFRLGLFAAFLAVLALVSSGVLTSVGMHLAVSDDAATQGRGVSLLRRMGRRDILLKACSWDRNNPIEGLQLLLLPSRERLSAEQAQTLFYRVTGEDHTLARGRGWNVGRSFGRRSEAALEWDTEQGGNRVGGLLKGLSLYGSRYEAITDAAAGVAYAEWTIIFRNDYRATREARARIALPPGGVVSRLTLWIDGEEREAAFGGRSQVRQAYERIVRRNRDPVLVSTCGPDLIQVQCFPVPANGGEMKLRLGITAPLRIDAEGRSGILDAPAIATRNFRLVREAITLPSALTLPLEPPLAPFCWARDSRSETPANIRQTAERLPAWRPKSVAFVLDGSLAMAACIERIAVALNGLPPGRDVKVWFVGDSAASAPSLTFTSPADTATIDRIKRLLQPANCLGGRCNLRTLQTAWDELAYGAEPSALIWLHGPQPFPVMSADDLCRRLERAPAHLRFYAAQTAPGTCRISEALDGVGSIRTLPPKEALDDVVVPLHRLFNEWTEGQTEWQMNRTRAEVEAAGEGTKASDQLVRLWTAEEVRRLLISGQPMRREQAQKLALAWNLVTPVSSAVVLETAQQYREAGLEPVTASSVPTVPEPAFWISLLLAGAVLAVWQWRRRNARNAA